MLIGKKVLLFLKIKKYNFTEQLLVVLKFYRSLRFSLLDLSILMLNLFQNSFRTSRKFLQKKGVENIHVYGETPLTTIEKIATICKINQDDVVLELGSGRGRSCFWLNHFIKCRVLAVEWIPSFVYFSKFLSKLFGYKVDFQVQDMFDMDYSKANIIYLYGTCLEDKEIIRLIEKVKSYKNMKVITISYPLSDYDKSFKTLKDFKVSFSWGETNCYLQQAK